jgi:hypothetical protein
MSTATLPDDMPPQLKKITELRNRLLQLTGSGHGPEVQAIMGELMALHPKVQFKRLVTDPTVAVVRRFVKGE